MTEVIEDAIAAFARPETPSHGGIPFPSRGAPPASPSSPPRKSEHRAWWAESRCGLTAARSAPPAAACAEGQFQFNKTEPYSVDADAFADLLHDFVRTVRTPSLFLSPPPRGRSQGSPGPRGEQCVVSLAGALRGIRVSGG